MEKNCESKVVQREDFLLESVGEKECVGDVLETKDENSQKSKVLQGEALPLKSVGEKACVGVLETKDENNLEVELVCSHCKKTKPSKRCAKRHMKCLQKIFCNETCEMLSHKKKEDPNADNPKTETTKKNDAKKKKTKDKKKENMKHGHVRASIAYKDYE